MDNKPLELEALCQIKALVAKYGYTYAEVNFDKNGADFLIIKDEDGDTYRYLRCQSKGRCIFPNNSNVVIPHSYVKDNFLVFVYLKPENVDEAKTYLFTAEDIKKDWADTGNTYRLYLPSNYSSNHENDIYLLNKERANLIEGVLDSIQDKVNRESVIAISDSDFYFRMWQKTGTLPSLGYLRNINEDEDMLAFLQTGQYIFLLCSLVIQTHEYDSDLSIDIAFDYLKELKGGDESPIDFVEGKKYYSVAAYVYRRTWVSEMLYSDGSLQGYHLHMGDDEECIDAYVMRNSDYWVV